MSSVLEMHDVYAGYVVDIDILRGVSLKIESGAITGLIGLNGAGKSTIMKTICGFLRPHAGRIALYEADITALAAHEMIDRGICYIPQESSLFPAMSVKDNLRLALDHLARRRNGLTRHDVAARFDD